MKLKKGDNVIVITGKDKGKKGKILEVLPRVNRVVVEEVNVAKIHTKSRARGKAEEIVKRAMPIHASNIMIVDPTKDVRTRVGIKRIEGKNVRVTKVSGAEL
ncbi:MAG: 50S ribosomal protein L24 [Parcubacteria group bacterium GW2011_GWA1_47_8]|nr:MAG: 50S ribosomal protein L24 [Parcubacteria group bacterium GW2011_GWA1_47_8]KKW07659.1 MAG: 50S ribosomal protein L24 [Parcubacteria group bacterium GW2011_GWA2_49_16]